LTTPSTCISTMFIISSCSMESIIHSDLLPLTLEFDRLRRQLACAEADLALLHLPSNVQKKNGHSVHVCICLRIVTHFCAVDPINHTCAWSPLTAGGHVPGSYIQKFSRFGFLHFDSNLRRLQRLPARYGIECYPIVVADPLLHQLLHLRPPEFEVD